MCRERIRSLLQEELELDIESVEDDEPIISSGLIDSFAMVTLMGALERAFDIRIAPTEVALKNMDSIDQLVRYVRDKQRG